MACGHDFNLMFRLVFLRKINSQNPARLVRCSLPRGCTGVWRDFGTTVISRLPEGAIDGAALRGVDSPVASDLLVVRAQTARKYVPDTTFQTCWSSVTCWRWILLRWSISAILL